MADPKTNTEQPNVEQIFGNAENALRQSMQTLGEWGDQARDVLQNRPGVVLASVSIAGFMTGVLLRQGGFKRATGARAGWAADPIIVFLTGAVAGLTLGPRILRDLGAGSEEPREFHH